MTIISFANEAISGFTESLSKIPYEGNGMCTTAYVKNDDGTLEMWDAYLMIDGEDNSYVDLCKWYDAEGNEVPRGSEDAECVVEYHCPIVQDTKSVEYDDVNSRLKTQSTMIAHELKFREIIWDSYDCRWGVICLINGKETDATVKDGDEIITYNPFDIETGEIENGECETMAKDAYPLARGKYFWGEEVCTEINKDNFDKEHDFDYYCPSRGENCWEFEAV